jgi:hypothetical protein
VKKQSSQEQAAKQEEEEDDDDDEEEEEGVSSPFLEQLRGNGTEKRSYSEQQLLCCHEFSTDLLFMSPALLLRHFVLYFP